MQRSNQSQNQRHNNVYEEKEEKREDKKEVCYFRTLFSYCCAFGSAIRESCFIRFL